MRFGRGGGYSDWGTYQHSGDVARLNVASRRGLRARPQDDWNNVLESTDGADFSRTSSATHRALVNIAVASTIGARVAREAQFASRNGPLG